MLHFITCIYTLPFQPTSELTVIEACLKLLLSIFARGGETWLPWRTNFPVCLLLRTFLMAFGRRKVRRPTWHRGLHHMLRLLLVPLIFEVRQMSVICRYRKHLQSTCPIVQAPSMDQQTAAVEEEKEQYLKANSQINRSPNMVTSNGLLIGAAPLEKTGSSERICNLQRCSSVVQGN